MMDKLNSRKLLAGVAATLGVSLEQVPVEALWLAGIYIGAQALVDAVGAWKGRK